MGSGMATPPVAGVMSPPVMRMPGQQMGGMVAPTGVIPQQMVMPATGNSVPPTSLAFRSSTPPSGNLTIIQLPNTIKSLFKITTHLFRARSIRVNN